MQWLYRLTDLLWLNLLTLVCSLPVFTVGAAQAGLYYAVSRLFRDEGTVTRDFFRAFRDNFAKATPLWLIWLGAGVVVVFAAGFYIIRPSVPGIVVLPVGILLLLGALVWLLSLSWLTPLTVTFENTRRRTATNAITLGFSKPLPSLLVSAMHLAPVLCWALDPVSFWKFGLVWIVGWFSLTAVVSTKVHGRILESMLPE